MKRLYAVCLAVVFGMVALTADRMVALTADRSMGVNTVTKGLIGKQDMSLGPGTFTRPTSTGGQITLDKISAMTFPVIGGDNNLTVNEYLTGRIDVRLWGIKTTNTAAQNDAAWALYAGAGKKVYFPAGVFLTNGGITMHDNVDIGGAGMGITWIKNANASKVRTFVNADTTNGNQNIRIHDLSIERTVLTGSYVAPSGNWNEFIAFTAQNGSGLNLKNNWVERVHFYSAAVPANAGDKVVIFWGQLGGGIKDCVLDADVDAFVTFANSEGGGYTDLYITAENNHIFGMKGTYAASAFVGGGSHVGLFGNYMYCPTTSGSPTFFEVGHPARFWRVDGNTLVTARGNFNVALAGADIDIVNNTIVSTDNTYPGAAVGASLSSDGGNYARRWRISRNTIVGGWIRINNNDNASVSEDIEIEENVIDNTIIRSSITIGGPGVKKNIKIRRNKGRYGALAGIDVSGAFVGLWIEDNDMANFGQGGDASYSHGIFFNSGTSGGPFFVNRNAASDNQAVKTQKWGIELDSGSATVLDEFNDNKMWGNATANFVVGLATFLDRHGNKYGLAGASSGRVTLDNGAKTVSSAQTLANDTIHLTRIAGGGTGRGHLQVGTITAGTSFVIQAVDNVGAVVTTDNSVVVWKYEH